MSRRRKKSNGIVFLMFDTFFPALRIDGPLVDKCLEALACVFLLHFHCR